MSHSRILRLPFLGVRGLGLLFASLFVVLLMLPAAFADPSASPSSIPSATGSSASPSGSDAPSTVGASKVMKVEDGCLDDDYITIPKIKGFRYLLNGEVVSGRIKYAAQDKLQVGIIKQGKLVGDYYDVSRRAVGLTDSECGEDGKPIPERTLTARPGTDSRVVGGSTGGGLRSYVIYALIAAILAVIVGTVIYVARKRRHRAPAHVRTADVAERLEEMKPKWRPRRGDSDQM